MGDPLTLCCVNTTSETIETSINSTSLTFTFIPFKLCNQHMIQFGELLSPIWSTSLYFSLNKLLVPEAGTYRQSDYSPGFLLKPNEPAVGRHPTTSINIGRSYPLSISGLQRTAEQKHQLNIFKFSISFFGLTFKGNILVFKWI